MDVYRFPAIFGFVQQTDPPQSCRVIFSVCYIFSSFVWGYFVHIEVLMFILMTILTLAVFYKERFMFWLMVMLLHILVKLIIYKDSGFPVLNVASQQEYRMSCGI